MHLNLIFFHQSVTSVGIYKKKQKLFFDLANAEAKREFVVNYIDVTFCWQKREFQKFLTP